MGFVISLTLTADYFRWQDARYNLISELLSGGIPAEDIDGGFEYNNLAAVIANPQGAVSMSRVDPANRTVRLKREPEPGDQIVATEQYTSLLGPRVGAI